MATLDYGEFPTVVGGPAQPDTPAHGGRHRRRKSTKHHRRKHRKSTKHHRRKHRRSTRKGMRRKTARRAYLFGGTDDPSNSMGPLSQAESETLTHGGRRRKHRKSTKHRRRKHRKSTRKGMRRKTARRAYMSLGGKRHRRKSTKHRRRKHRKSSKHHRRKHRKSTRKGMKRKTARRAYMH